MTPHEPPDSTAGHPVSGLVLFDIEQAIISLFRRLDDADAEGVAAAFASDGVWHHGGRILTGRTGTSRNTVQLDRFEG